MTFLHSERLEQTRQHLLEHPVYQSVQTMEHVKIMMRHHVFAVWDFMSLLKRLQQIFTGSTIPWTPSPHPEYTRFINEIVLAEESDEDGQGGYLSHFEIYLKAMEQVGADTGPIQHVIQKISSGTNPFIALEQASLPASITQFVKQCLYIAYEGQPHEVAASFFFGREDLIPDMFTKLLKTLDEKNLSTSWLHFYLQRHIELDGDHHGPLAKRLLLSLCGDDSNKQSEAIRVAEQSLQARIRLWDGVVHEIHSAIAQR